MKVNIVNKTMHCGYDLAASLVNIEILNWKQSTYQCDFSSVVCLFVGNTCTNFLRKRIRPHHRCRGISKID